MVPMALGTGNISYVGMNDDVFTPTVDTSVNSVPAFKATLKEALAVTAFTDVEVRHVQRVDKTFWICFSRCAVTTIRTFKLDDKSHS